MEDKKDQRNENERPERLEERDIPDLNEQKNNDCFNKIEKSEDHSREDSSASEESYISKPRISSELPPAFEE